MEIPVLLSVLGSIVSGLSVVATFRSIVKRKTKPEKLSITIGNNKVVVEADEGDMEKIRTFVTKLDLPKKYTVEVEELPETKHLVRPKVKLEPSQG